MKITHFVAAFETPAEVGEEFDAPVLPDGRRGRVVAEITREEFMAEMADIRARPITATSGKSAGEYHPRDKRWKPAPEPPPEYKYFYRAEAVPRIDCDPWEPKVELDDV